MGRLLQSRGVPPAARLYGYLRKVGWNSLNSPEKVAARFGGFTLSICPSFTPLQLFLKVAVILQGVFEDEIAVHVTVHEHIEVGIAHVPPAASLFGKLIQLGL